MTENYLLPLFPDGISDMELPVHCRKKGHLVGVDLANLETRYLAPCTSRVVPILQILGCQNQSGEEHPTATLKGADGRNILGLLHGEIKLRHMGFDEDKVVQGNLKRGVTCSRTAQGLLDKCTQRQYTTTGSGLTSASRNGSGPDDLNHLCGRILRR